ncbi:MAG TPA: prolipoprotein diacylglyceryl transferase [Caulobacter sp.]|nr:prolipoprotein diacylglyceryl transferase [Caulobacter sp.]
MIFPNIDPVVHLGPWALQWGPLALRWYALAYVAGILLGWRFAIRLTRTERLWGGRAPTATPLQIDDLVLWITLGIILGGRIGYILFYMLLNHDQRVWLLAHPLDVFKIWEGGMSFHGGFLGVCAAVVLFARKNRIDMLKLGDLIAPVAPIGLFFGRLANFINGELWGRPTDGPWGIVFCNETIKANHPQHICPAGPFPRHPSQLYEAGLEGVLLFLILAFCVYRLKWLQRRGALVATFLLAYGLFRLSLENVRNPDLGMPDFPLGLTMGMMLSTPMILVGGWLLWKALREPVPPPEETKGGDEAHEPA